MADDSDARADETALRRAHVRKRALMALHHLVEAVAANEAGSLVYEVGEANRELAAAEAEILRGPLA